MHRNCPLKNESARPAYNIQEVGTVGQVARVVTRIYAALEDHQADHQSTVVEVALMHMSKFATGFHCYFHVSSSQLRQ